MSLSPQPHPLTEATPPSDGLLGPRKPRLTDRVLDDLPEALASIQADIDYLRDAVPGCAKGSALHTRMAQRLLEANDRGYWQPDDATLDALRDASDALEDRLEGVA